MSILPRELAHRVERQIAAHDAKGASRRQPASFTLPLPRDAGRDCYFFMVELEVYAAGLRTPEKMMALNFELESLADCRCKVDTNHDIVYMEFGGPLPSLNEVESMFRKAGLEPKFVGTLPEQLQSKKKTQRLDLSA